MALLPGALTSPTIAPRGPILSFRTSAKRPADAKRKFGDFTVLEHGERTGPRVPLVTLFEGGYRRMRAVV